MLNFTTFSHESFFEEKYDGIRGITQIIVLDKGKQLIMKGDKK